MRFLIRLLISALALWVAIEIVPGVSYSGEWVKLLLVALVLGLLNALVRPLLLFLSCPMLILTLGLFTLVVNAVVLWLTSALSGKLGLGFHVTGFGAAFLGALVVSIVSFLLSVFAPDPERA
ncbi:MAG TPA: phage holin family protein [Thermoanaerobaculia bacterium]|nr:phage holin family protein [Thermoanaerobaculia bacterium]